MTLIRSSGLPRLTGQPFFSPALLAIVVMAATGLSSCARDPLPRSSYTQEEWASREALALVSSLTPEEKAAQVLLVGIDG
ncbi:MAG TPA: hypothetical protein PLU93_11505, partial [Treponemataceae bacterium]|nr:hypothetical protein [Treponemataceae bacterium]